ncbi:MAG: class I tRNA ligase family protein, partial [Fervidicoccaceae archaeon]
KLGRAEEFERTWLDPNTRTVYFIGKDNIPFHAIILPAMLMASGRPYALPWQIGATEYLLFHEEKFSKSRGVGVWADEALELLPADYWRFALIRMRPETKDTSFSWREFYRVVNDELNDDVGNYIHRVLTFAKRKYGSVPGPGSMEAEDAVFWSDVERLTKRAIEMYSSTRLRAASDAIVELARRGNQYLNARAPWDLVRDRPSEAEAVIYLALNSLRTLALLLYPIMPSSSSKLYSMLGLEGPKPGEMRLAGEISLRPGHELGQPEPLFRKLPEDFPERADELLAEARNRAQAGRPRVAR